MGYQPIHQYLARFSHLKPPDESVRRVVRNTIAAVCGITIPMDAIRIVRGVVRLSVSPIERSEIALAKEEILRRVRHHLPDCSLRDIG
jgi:hypothetical protein